MSSSRVRLCVRLGGGAVVAIIAIMSTWSAATASQSMPIGGFTSQPIGHYDFCKSHRAECEIRSRDNGPEHMTGKLWRQITSVNLTVNNNVKPMSDLDQYGQDEFWAYPDSGFGDCEDYALEKRRRLINSGIPVSDLLMTVVRKPDGEGHAVLTVRTDTGDFILDNLTDTVRRWDQTGYRFLKRQAGTDTGRWVSLDGDNPLVSAIK
ncbi:MULTISPECIES: transglutaminase-like cysteine peptidase [unclassified Mesorhizobium]|uniref:transglutaminase-like cysteine peptidase n=1 Tax=unclassified Mesorhizobium TaxID=325217 RepID=UPI0004CF8660|nr:transglutaminase-like cysteine peptidase [Mesorhizobium sp. LSJC280B00]